MIYLKSIASGLAGAVAAALLMLLLEALAFALLVWSQSRSGGSGGIAAVSLPTTPLLVFAAAGFIGGFWWSYRKRSA